jgi:ankyrin repeat protein
MDNKMQFSIRAFFMGLFVILALTAVLGCAPSKEEQVESLLRAARVGDTKTVKSLLERGVDVNARKYPKGWTALHYAAGGAHVDTVKSLLASGADVEASGAPDGGKSGGVVINVKPLFLSQIARETLQRMSKEDPGGRWRLADEPDKFLWPEGDGADQRYQTVISLLTAAGAR